MVLQPVLAGFLQEHPHVQLELTNDEGFVDIVEKGFDAGVRLGESVQRDMVAVPSEDRLLSRWSPPRSTCGGFLLRAIGDTLFSLDAALEGVGLAYTFEALALPHIRAKRLKRVLASFSPTFPGFYLYYPSRRDQPTKLKALIEYFSRRAT